MTQVSQVSDRLRAFEYEWVAAWMTSPIMALSAAGAATTSDGQSILAQRES